MAKAAEVAVLRIELQGIEPLIWRRVAVRTMINLTDLDRVVQAAMGWLNCHLWRFEIEERRYAVRSETDWNERHEDAGSKTLGKIVESGTRTFEYVYDMGDYWEHSIIVERVMAPLPEVTYPQFLGGERRCPPEDCGGPQGYYEFLKNISSKQRRVREEALAWCGKSYDPDDIDETTIIRSLGRIGESGRR